MFTEYKKAPKERLERASFDLTDPAKTIKIKIKLVPIDAVFIERTNGDEARQCGPTLHIATLEIMK